MTLSTGIRFPALRWPLLAALAVTMCPQIAQARHSHHRGADAMPTAAATRCAGGGDSAPVLQSALDAADPAKGGSGVVAIPGGAPCLLGSALKLHSGETLVGQTASATLAPLVPYPNRAANPLLLSMNGVTGVTIKNLTIDGRATAVGTSSSLVVVFSSDRVVFDGVTAKNSRGTAITFSAGPRGVTHSGITNSHFNNIGTYYLTSGNAQTDRKQSVSWCCGAQNASGEYPNQHNFVTSSVFAQNGFDNLSFTQQSWFLVTGNQFGGSHNGANIYCAHNSHVRIAGNTGTSASGNGIDCFVNTDLAIVHNTSSRNGAAGIQIAETHCGLIQGNTTMNNFQASRSDWGQTHPGVKGTFHQGGITIGGEKANTIGTADVTIADNISGDDQAQPTQKFGIMVRPNATVHNLAVMPNNRLSGNLGGAFGEALKGVSPKASAGCSIWSGRS